MKNIITSILIALFALIASHSILAKTITLFDQPKNDAKAIGSIDPASGIIPIFTPKDSSWIKVADPTNGNVGWIKSNDFNTVSKTSGFSFKMINTGNGPNNFQVIQFGGPNPFTSEQSQALIKQMETRTKALQKDMEMMVHDMFNGLNLTTPNFPILVPVIMVPQEATAPKKSQPASGSSPVLKK